VIHTPCCDSWLAVIHEPPGNCVTLLVRCGLPSILHCYVHCWVHCCVPCYVHCSVPRCVHCCLHCFVHCSSHRHQGVGLAALCGALESVTCTCIMLFHLATQAHLLEGQTLRFCGCDNQQQRPDCWPSCRLSGLVLGWIRSSSKVLRPLQGVLRCDDMCRQVESIYGTV
jgi:hypothetical protein